MAKDKAGQASDALEEGARQAADTAQKVAADTSEAIESGAQQVRSPFQPYECFEVFCAEYVLLLCHTDAPKQPLYYNQALAGPFRLGCHQAPSDLLGFCECCCSSESCVRSRRKLTKAHLCTVGG